MVRFLALAVLLAAPVGARAESCPGMWARLAGGARRAPSYAREKAVGWKDQAKEIWTEDYLGAWRRGETLPEKSYRFLRRALIAPRSRNKDPALREAELKKFSLLPALLDPILDGSVETVSKLRVLAGREPLRGRASIPAGLAAGAATAGIYAGIYDYYRERADTKDITGHLNRGALGLAYLEEWRKRGVISAREEIKLYNRHNKIMARWAAGIAGSGPRWLPPRLTQLVREGALRPEETAAFEALALQAFRAAAGGEGATEEERVRTALRRLLAGDPRFNRKPGEDLDLLMRFFDPPVFIGSEEGIRWLEKVRDGKAPAYDEKLRQRSDLFWLRGVAKGEGDTFRAVRALDQRQEIDAAILAYLSLAAPNREEIAARKRWAESVGFPPEKMYIASRVEFPPYRMAPIHFFGKDGAERALEKEDDFWELIVSHPGFADLKEKWIRSPDHGEADTMLEVRRRAAEIHLLQALQNDRRKDGKLLDPAPAQFCLLMGRSPYFGGPVDRALADLGDADDDAKLFCRYHFAIQRWRALGIGGDYWDKRFLPDATYCAGAGALEKFAQAIKADASQVREALRCENGDWRPPPRIN